MFLVAVLCSKATSGTAPDVMANDGRKEKAVRPCFCFTIEISLHSAPFTKVQITKKSQFMKNIQLTESVSMLDLRAYRFMQGNIEGKRYKFQQSFWNQVIL